MVTHNEMFLHALADRLIVFSDVGARLFDGGYQDFLAAGGWGDDAALTRRHDATDGPEAPAATKLTKKELRRLRSEIITEKSRVLKPMEDTIAAAEQAIETSETLLDQLNQEMVQASQAGNGTRIGELSQKIRVCQETIETRFAEMEAADEQRQRMEKKFEKRLAELDG
jgi:ATP-binding cassette subfamily F protein 3